jgi:hypothetical protein
VVVTENEPELLVFSTYGIDHLRFRCCKIYYSHENTVANSRLCDFSFAFKGRGPGHHYFSNFVEDEHFEELRTLSFSAKVADWRNAPKSKFCNFVYSNSAAKERIEFCQLLMQYKRVDFPGRVLNNCPPFDSHGYTYEKKLEFLKDYRFTIAFENESAVKYTTEKIYHPFLVGSIPIYWGNPRVAELFNPASFINCHDFDTFDAVVAHVRKVEQAPDGVARYLAQPPILAGTPLAGLSPVFLLARLLAITTTARGGPAVSQRIWFPVYRLLYYICYRSMGRIDNLCERIRKR